MLTTLQQNRSYDILYNGNLGFRKLCDEHIELKKEIIEISKSKFLNETETDILHLKKVRKLAVKDKIESMLVDRAS